MKTSDLQHRILNALEILKEGNASFDIGDLTLSCTDNTQLTIVGWSIIKDLNNLTKSFAEKELIETKQLFQEMVNISPELFSFIKNRKIEYILGHNYGMGNIVICNEKDEKVIWEITLKE